MYRLKRENKQIRDMFSSIARRYDFLNRFLSVMQDQKWRRECVSEIGVRSGGTHLDLACGTADVAIELVRQIDGAHVVCADISYEMLELAREKAKRLHIEEKFSFLLCAGESLPFKERSFDSISIAFGIRNMVERGRALKEMARILKEGGTLSILEFSLPQKPLFKSLYLFYFTRLLPWLGGVFSSRSAYTYLPHSVLSFPDREDFTVLLEECGFRDISWRDLSGGIVTLYRSQV